MSGRGRNMKGDKGMDQTDPNNALEAAQLLIDWIMDRPDYPARSRVLDQLRGIVSAAYNEINALDD